MRAYRLHESSWKRIVTHRVRRPQLIATRLSSRRRPTPAIPVDGQLVLIDAHQVIDPRTERPVERRELLDRLVEALSVPGVDGVVGPADVLEELTLLNMLEHRLAFCLHMGEGPGAAAPAISAGHFDGACLATSGYETSAMAVDVADLHAAGLPVIVDLVQQRGDLRSEYETDWTEWAVPLRSAAAAVVTGRGLWFTVPPMSGMANIARLTGHPVLVRDTDVPIEPSTWTALFEQTMPLTVRGLVAGPSALFPLDGTVESATTIIAAAVRSRIG